LINWDNIIKIIGFVAAIVSALVAMYKTFNDTKKVFYLENRNLNNQKLSIRLGKINKTNDITIILLAVAFSIFMTPSYMTEENLVRNSANITLFFSFILIVRVSLRMFNSTFIKPRFFIKHINYGVFIDRIITIILTSITILFFNLSLYYRHFEFNLIYISENVSLFITILFIYITIIALNIATLKLLKRRYISKHHYIVIYDNGKERITCEEIFEEKDFLILYAQFDPNLLEIKTESDYIYKNRYKTHIVRRLKKDVVNDIIFIRKEHFETSITRK